MASHEFAHVFQPIQVGKLHVKNRIEVSPAEPFLASRDGLITDEFLAFTEQLAKSGAGIVTIGDSPVNQEYADHNHYVVNLADPFVVHGLFKLTEMIHRYNTIASIELNLRADYLPADLTVQEVRGIIDDFATSAHRCMKGGFDMLMLHGGHGHTVAQFFSPYFNKRTDEYGTTTFENRCRFANELIDAVREAIGPNMAIEWRISGDEMLEPEKNVGVEEVLEFAKNIQGKIDLLHVSAGNLYDKRAIGYMIQNAYKPRPTNVHLARFLKPKLDIPVTSVGSYNIELAEQAIAAGDTDLVAMIRPFIADPNLLHKAKAGQAETIRPCIRCNVCTGDDPHGCPTPLRCTVNPVAGREREFAAVEPPAMAKTVAIVGGGAAGLEVAWWLAERGHRPVIFEREEQLGGSLKLAGANSIKTDVRRYGSWSIERVLADERIDVHLGVEDTPAAVRELAPDALVVAVGSTPIIPRVPGVDGSNVVLATKVDEDPQLAKGTVVIVGAGLTGTETAILLARGGHAVTMVDMQSRAQLDKVKATSQAHALADDEGVTFMDCCALKEIHDDRIVVAQADDTLVDVPCDTVVMSLGVRPRLQDIEALQDICEETYVIGDCANRAGNITSAVREAFFAALNI